MKFVTVVRNSVSKMENINAAQHEENMVKREQIKELLRNSRDHEEKYKFILEILESKLGKETLALLLAAVDEHPQDSKNLPNETNSQPLLLDSAKSNSESVNIEEYFDLRNSNSNVKINQIENNKVKTKNENKESETSQSGSSISVDDEIKRKSRKRIKISSYEEEISDHTTSNSLSSVKKIYKVTQKKGGRKRTRNLSESTMDSEYEETPPKKRVKAKAKNSTNNPKVQKKKRSRISSHSRLQDDQKNMHMRDEILNLKSKSRSCTKNKKYVYDDPLEDYEEFYEEETSTGTHKNTGNSVDFTAPSQNETVPAVAEVALENLVMETSTLSSNNNNRKSKNQMSFKDTINEQIVLHKSVKIPISCAVEDSREDNDEWVDTDEILSDDKLSNESINDSDPEIIEPEQDVMDVEDVFLSDKDMKKTPINEKPDQSVSLMSIDSIETIEKTLPTTSNTIENPEKQRTPRNEKPMDVLCSTPINNTSSISDKNETNSSRDLWSRKGYLYVSTIGFKETHIDDSDEVKVLFVCRKKSGSTEKISPDCKTTKNQLDLHTHLSVHHGSDDWDGFCDICNTFVKKETNDKCLSELVHLEDVHLNKKGSARKNKNPLVPKIGKTPDNQVSDLAIEHSPNEVTINCVYDHNKSNVSAIEPEKYLSKKEQSPTNNNTGILTISNENKLDVAEGIQPTIKEFSQLTPSKKKTITDEESSKIQTLGKTPKKLFKSPRRSPHKSPSRNKTTEFPGMDIRSYFKKVRKLDEENNIVESPRSYSATKDEVDELIITVENSSDENVPNPGENISYLLLEQGELPLTKEDFEIFNMPLNIADEEHLINSDNLLTNMEMSICNELLVASAESCQNQDNSPKNLQIISCKPNSVESSPRSVEPRSSNTFLNVQEAANNPCTTAIDIKKHHLEPMIFQPYNQPTPSTVNATSLQNTCSETVFTDSTESPLSSTVPTNTLHPWLSNFKISKTPLALEKIQNNTLYFDHKFKCMQNQCVFTIEMDHKFKYHLESHKQMGINLGFLNCCYCHFEGETIEKLIYHLNMYHKYDRYQCSACYYRSATEACLQCHIKLHHQSNTQFSIQPNCEEIDFSKQFSKVTSSRERNVPPISCPCKYESIYNIFVN